MRRFFLKILPANLYLQGCGLQVPDQYTLFFLSCFVFDLKQENCVLMLLKCFFARNLNIELNHEYYSTIMVEQSQKNIFISYCFY